MHPAKAQQIRSIARQLASQMELIGIDRAHWAEEIESRIDITDPGPDYLEFRTQMRALIAQVVAEFDR
jgi:hypothetical protein